MQYKNKEIIKYYHERTKHKPYKFARSPEFLDWRNEPKPFRRYSGTEKIKLPLYDPEDSPPFYKSLFQLSDLEPAQFNIESISKLLLFSLGISAWKEYKGLRWALRCNPSAGNLHPIETYIITPPNLINNEKATLYHYVADEHLLELRATDENSNWNEFYRGNLSSNFIIVGLSIITWRMAWKYGERALRYCLLDVGHAISAITYSARALGWKTTALLEINWHQQEILLGLNRKEFENVEKETPQILLLIYPNNLQPNIDIKPNSSIPLFNNWFGSPEKISPENVEWKIIDETISALKKSSIEFSSLFSSKNNTNDSENSLLHTPKTILHSPSCYTLFRKRRSAHELDPKIVLPLEKFELILQNLKFVKNKIIKETFGINLHTLIVAFIHSVEALNPGIYFFPLENLHLLETLKDQHIPPKTRNSKTIYLLENGNYRKFATHLLCGQNVGGNSATLFGIFADLQKAVDRHGEFAYALLHWEAGFLVHHLYLESELIGLQGTGVGCFFDDEFNFNANSKYSYIKEMLPLYFYALGKPIPDTRLKSYPPYPET